MRNQKPNTKATGCWRWLWRVRLSSREAHSSSSLLTAHCSSLDLSAPASVNALLGCRLGSGEGVNHESALSLCLCRVLRVCILCSVCCLPLLTFAMLTLNSHSPHTTLLHEHFAYVFLLSLFAIFSGARLDSRILSSK